MAESPVLGFCGADSVQLAVSLWSDGQAGMARIIGNAEYRHFVKV